jgi:hypothetical protein
MGERDKPTIVARPDGSFALSRLERRTHGNPVLRGIPEAGFRPKALEPDSREKQPFL